MTLIDAKLDVVLKEKGLTVITEEPQEKKGFFGFLSHKEKEPAHRVIKTVPAEETPAELPTTDKS